jgi:nucleotide-binding universal stress UspA family protein
VALDGSSEAERVLGHLPPLAGKGVELVLLHVLPEVTPPTGDLLLEFVGFRKQAESYLAGIRRRLRRFPTRRIVEFGDPADRIIWVADDLDVEAIAMTTHARSGAARVLLGSVASEVVRRSGRPVLLVRPGLAPLRRLRRKILIPLVDPGDVGTLIDSMLSLASAARSEIVLLHVLPFPLVTDPVTGFTPVPLRPLKLPHVPWLEEARRIVEDRGLRARTRTAFGDPVDRILRVSRSEDVDLIAMKARSRRGLSRLFLGSITDELLRRSERLLLLLHPVGRGADRKATSAGESGRGE